MSRFITVKEIKEELKCNVNYIYDLLALQIIKNFKVGRNYRILRKDYEEFLVYADTHDLPDYEELRMMAHAARAKRRTV